MIGTITTGSRAEIVKVPDHCTIWRDSDIRLTYVGAWGFLNIESFCTSWDHQLRMTLGLLTDVSVKAEEVYIVQGLNR